MLPDYKILNTTEYKIENSRDGVNLAIVENPHNHKNKKLDIFTKYPSHTEMNKLIKLIADYNNVSISQILVTNGSGKALDLILDTYPKKKILIPIPNYPGFIHSAELKANVTKTLFYGKEYNKLDIESHDIIYFSSPNLPLGYIKTSQINIWVEMYPEKIFIIDEAYYEYDPTPSIRNKNVITTRTFSKAFGLAGARIGYIITHPTCIKYLRVSYSTKDILDISISMAINVLQNKKLYISRAKCDNITMEYIKKRLNNIPKGDIYDFMVPKTPWFLIFCKNPERVCKIFYLYGYIVRNKSSDIKNAVRIGLPADKDLNKVLNIIEKINTNMKYSRILFDLDETLRGNHTTEMYKYVKKYLPNMMKKYNITVVTNNTENKSVIEKIIKPIPGEQLICPISDIMNPSNTNWFIYKKMVYILNYPTISYKLLSAIKQYKIICVVEKDLYINSSEFGLIPSIKMPHIGTFLKTIDYLDFELKVIGKEMYDFSEKNVLVVGDGNSDKLMAYKNNYDFIKISKTRTIKNVFDMLLNL